LAARVLALGELAHLANLPLPDPAAPHVDRLGLPVTQEVRIDQRPQELRAPEVESVALVVPRIPRSFRKLEVDLGRVLACLRGALPRELAKLTRVERRTLELVGLAQELRGNAELRAPIASEGIGAAVGLPLRRSDAIDEPPPKLRDLLRPRLHLPSGGCARPP